jgi:hypothetical protein
MRHAGRSLVVGNARHSRDGSREVISVPIEAGGRHHEVWYAFPGPPPRRAGEALIALALLPAMRLGHPLVISGIVSPVFLQAVPLFQRIFRSWDPSYQEVPVHVDGTEPDGPARQLGACFLSGGVDSFYSLLSHSDAVSHSIFIHGFDIPLAERDLRERLVAPIRNAAAQLRKPLIEVETNLRDFVDPYVPWDHCNGPALVSVALLLSAQFSDLYAGATHPHAAPFPWQPPAGLTASWSTEGVRVINDDGHGVSRVDKVAAISRSEVVLRTLRVCWENPGGAYNCGRCEKCLRTMVALRLAGALERCTTFARPLDLFALARLQLGHNRYFMQENYDAAVRGGRDPKLRRALRDCLAGRYNRWGWRVARKMFRLMPIPWRAS